MTQKAFFFQSLISKAAIIFVACICVLASYLGYRAANWTLIRYDQWRVAELGANAGPIRRTESFYVLLSQIGHQFQSDRFAKDDHKFPAVGEKELDAENERLSKLARKSSRWTAEDDEQLWNSMFIVLLVEANQSSLGSKIAFSKMLTDDALERRGDFNEANERTEQLSALSILLGVDNKNSSTIVAQAALYQQLFKQAQESSGQATQNAAPQFKLDESKITSPVFSVTAYKKRVITELCLQLNGRMVGDNEDAKTWRNRWETLCAPRVRYLLFPSYGTGELIPRIEALSPSYLFEFVVRLFFGLLVSLICIVPPLLLGLFSVALLLRLRQLVAPLTKWTEGETLKVALSDQVE